MKKETILLILAVLVNWISAPCQTITRAKYFINTDPGTGKGTPISISADSVVNTTFSIPGGGLRVGFNQLFIRVMDNNNNWSISEQRGFYVDNGTVRTVPLLTKAEYFFDTDPGTGKGTPITISSNDSINLAININPSALSPGFHQLFIRTKDNNNNWSISEQRVIYVYNAAILTTPQITSAEYFFDTDPGNGKATPITISAGDSINLTVDINHSSVSPGFHQLFIRTKDINNNWSITEQRTLYVDNGKIINAPPLIAAEYFTGSDPGIGSGIPIQLSKADSLEDSLNYTASNLPFGGYNISVRVKDSAGHWSIAEGRPFTCIKYVFTGDGDWDSTSNWQSGLVAPDSILGGVEVDIDHVDTGECIHNGDLEIQSGGLVTVFPNKELSIIGDLSNSGTLNGTGTVSFEGGGRSALNSSGLISALLSLTNKQMYLTGHTNTNSISLAGGSNIALDSFNLNIGAGNLTGDSLDYIITNGTGALNRIIDSNTVTYYIGADSSTYTPVIISDLGQRPFLNRPDGSTNSFPVQKDSISVRVTNGVHIQGSVGSSIDSNVVDHTWFVTNSLSNDSNTVITMQWNAADEDSGFDHGHCYVSNFKTCPPPINCTNGYYDKKADAAASGNGPYTLSRKGIDNGGAFIVTPMVAVYTFTGSGDWNDPNNWTNGQVGPNTIASGMQVIINPPPGGQCTVNGDIIIQAGGALTVQSKKVLNVTGKIIVEQ